MAGIVSISSTARSEYGHSSVPVLSLAGFPEKSDAHDSTRSVTTLTVKPLLTLKRNEPGLGKEFQARICRSVAQRAPDALFSTTLTHLATWIYFYDTGSAYENPFFLTVNDGRRPLFRLLFVVR